VSGFEIRKYEPDEVFAGRRRRRPRPLKTKPAPVSREGRFQDTICGDYLFADFGDCDSVVFQPTGNGHFLAGMIENFRLIVELVDFAVVGYEHRG
jgi:hypothetical protein